MTNQSKSCGDTIVAIDRIPDVRSDRVMNTPQKKRNLFLGAPLFWLLVLSLPSGGT
eukprot:CAMPEP_0119413656 /NCGR_PEP_ID=MMETSP1335-20130426/5667_1 /TAXON_ID=259385 /ORGANISM="Chrysoculter rhomboideus, Strain RCC1486" /LENGTH=55 /DNA_ID=CAMNT_0007438461 /DNA_START=345 /DNA_END=512 /DNA_ORIENTATION=+